MNHFGFGWVSFIGAVLFAFLYLAGFGVRCVAAWSKRQPKPGDRVLFFIIVFALVGLVVGSFAQPLIIKGFECRDAGQPVASCLFFPK